MRIFAVSNRDSIEFKIKFRPFLVDNKDMKLSKYRIKNGFSIIEVLVTVGIMSIIMAGFSSMLIHQNRENKALKENFASLDLHKTLLSVLSYGPMCSYLLNNPTVLTFNTASLPQTLTPSLPIYASLPITTSSIPVAKIGETASSFSESMIVKSISLKVLSGSDKTYLAKWVIGFDEDKSVRAHKPVEITTILTVDNSSPTAAKIVDCMSEQVANRYLQSCASDEVMAGYNADGSIKCQKTAAIYAGKKCGSGQVLNGFNDDGTISCAASTTTTASSSGGGGAKPCKTGYQSMAGYVCLTW